ncbi:MAG: DHH family phosphoesterase, partial [Ruminococcus flavefaciens]|nr:DHH family phosphoesterase [Ruminococcus flavefaciens]
MNIRRGKFSSVLELVSHNTGMTEEELLDDRKVYRIDGLAEAKSILTEAMETQKIIYIFGDYDVDGVCSCAIIKTAMASIGYGGKTIVRLPRRFSEGYGVSEKALDEFADGQVLVTVDNGIAAMAAIKKAKEKRMQVIVIDHHLPPQDKNGNTVLPDADLIIDPKAIPGSADFDGYCGAGLAYRVMCRMVRDKRTVWKMLCLAAIATIADVMPLTGENRRIVKSGIACMTDINRTTSGLYALLLACECTEHVTEETVSYKLAPCLNAPGRLFDDGASDSYKLLSYDGSLAEARRMAEKQLEWNQTRRSLSKEWTDKAMELAETHALTGRRPIILRVDGTPEGIVGIVAGRVAEHVKCPCVILTQAEGQPGMLKGSARSYGETNLYELLRQGAEFLARFGGHKEAAGLSIMEDDLEAFQERID